MSKKTPSFWDGVEDKGEWVNFGDQVPVDVVLEDAEPKTVETSWGEATIVIVWQFPIDSLVGGLRKQLRINAVRLQRGLKLASPQGLPVRGNGYRIIRAGEGWATTYNVSFRGKFNIDPMGNAKPVESL